MNLSDSTDPELFNQSYEVYLGSRFMWAYLEMKQYVEANGVGNDPSILCKQHPRFYDPNKQWDDFAKTYHNTEAHKQRKRAFHGLTNARKGEQRPPSNLKDALFDAAGYEVGPESSHLTGAYTSIGREITPILLSGDDEALDAILLFAERLRTEGFMAIAPPTDKPLSDGKLKTNILLAFFRLCSQKSRLPTGDELWEATPGSVSANHRRKYQEALKALGIDLPQKSTPKPPP